MLGPPEGWPFAVEDDRLHRFAGSIGNPNAAGVAYVMLSLIAVAVARLMAARWVKRPGDGRLVGALAAAAVACSGFALVGMTQSRMALGLLLAGLMLQMAAGQMVAGKRVWRWWVIAGVIAVAAFVVVVAGSTLDRFGPVEVDGVGRAAVWGYYLALAGKAPLTDRKTHV